jgi:hypothetical protein
MFDLNPIAHVFWPLRCFRAYFLPALTPLLFMVAVKILKPGAIRLSHGTHGHKGKFKWTQRHNQSVNCDRQV